MSSTGSLLANTKRVLPDVSWSLANNIVGVIAGLGVVKIIGAWVPAADYGDAGLVLGAVGLLNQFIANPLLGAQLRLFYDHVTQGREASHFRSLEKLLLRTVSAIGAAYFLIALGFRASGREVYFQLLLPALLLIAVQPYLSAHLNLLEAKRNYRGLTIAQASSKLLQLPLLLALIIAVSIGKGSAVVLSQALALLAVLAVLLISRPKLAEGSDAAAAGFAFDGFSLALYGFNLFSWVLATSDRFLIDHFHDANDVGIYVLNYSLWSIPFAVLNGWIDSFTRPRLYTRAAAGNWGQVVELMRGKLLAAFGIALLGAGALYLIGERVALALIGPRYWHSVTLMMLLVLAHVFFVTGHTASTIFVAAKKAQPLWVTTLLAAGLNVALNLYYIPKYGIIAAAASTLAAYAFWTLLLLVAAFATKSQLRASIQSVQPTS